MYAVVIVMVGSCSRGAVVMLALIVVVVVGDRQ